MDCQQSLAYRQRVRVEGDAGVWMLRIQIPPGRDHALLFFESPIIQSFGSVQMLDGFRRSTFFVGGPYFALSTPTMSSKADLKCEPKSFVLMMRPDTPS